MSAFQIDIVVLVAALAALIVVGLMCLNSEVENTVDRRPSVVYYGVRILGHCGRICEHSSDVYRGSEGVLLGLACRSL